VVGGILRKEGPQAGKKVGDTQNYCLKKKIQADRKKKKKTRGRQGEQKGRH